jgi:hypothetical protein
MDGRPFQSAEGPHAVELDVESFRHCVQQFFYVFLGLKGLSFIPFLGIPSLVTRSTHPP